MGFFVVVVVVVFFASTFPGKFYQKYCQTEKFGSQVCKC